MNAVILKALRTSSAAVATTVLGLLCACSTQSSYQRPTVDLPADFGAAPAGAIASAMPQDWRTLYTEPQLAALIERALANNRDVQLAAARVLEARATLGIADFALLPNASVSGGHSRARSSEKTGNLPPGADAIRNLNQINLNASLEIDLWGRLRALTHAAGADLQQLENNRRATEIGVIATTASSWFTLIELDEEMRVTQATLDNQQRFLDLTQIRRTNGAATGLDVAQAGAAVEQTRAGLTDVTRRQRQAENAINVLLGRFGGPIERAPLAQASADAAPVPGLPSALLQRRPDVIAAENALTAAHERVAAARAALFPTISLTAALGGASQDLSDLLTRPARTWSLGANLFQPLLDSQRNGYQVDAAQARRTQALVSYQKTVEQAFREVRDALAAKEAALAAGAARAKQVAALQVAEQTSTLRYKGGLASYFEVIDAQRNLLSGQLALAQAQLASRQASVELYRSIGGGWGESTAVAAR